MFNILVWRPTIVPGVAPPVHCIDLGQVASEGAPRPHLYPAHRVQTSCDLPKHRKEREQAHTHTHPRRWAADPARKAKQIKMHLLVN